jgi:hypothetical protein
MLPSHALCTRYQLRPAETGGVRETQQTGDSPPYAANISKCEGTNTSKDEILVKRFRNIDAEMNVRRTVGCKDKGNGRRLDITVKLSLC